MAELYSMGNGLELPRRYDPNETREDNSLETQLNKHPEINKRVMDLAPQFDLNYLLEKFGRVSNSSAEKLSLGDSAYRWKARGHYFRPHYALAKSAPGKVTTEAGLNDHIADISDGVDHQFTFGIKHNPVNKEVGNDFNPNDLIRFQSGAVAIVTDIVAIDGQVACVTCKIIDGVVTIADLANDSIVARIGTAFGESSLGGYQNDRNEEWYINWTTTHRRSFSISGHAMTNVAWIVPNNGSKPLWYFEKVADEKKRFKRMQELTSLYGRASMNADDHVLHGKNGTNQLTLTGFNEKSGKTAPRTGDGLLAQISDSNKASFDINTGLTGPFLTEYMARLAQRSIGGGTQGKEWVVLAGTLGRLVLDKAFKEIAGVDISNGGAMYDLDSGKDLTLGANFTTYVALGNKFTIVPYDVFDDPTVHNSNGGITGTGDLVFLDWSLQDGQPNISMFHKRGRNYIEKYIDGMHTLSTESQMGSKFAASGKDGAECEMLSETMTVVKNPLSCGILKATGTYTGVVSGMANQTARDWFATT